MNTASPKEGKKNMVDEACFACCAENQVHVRYFSFPVLDQLRLTICASECLWERQLKMLYFSFSSAHIFYEDCSYRL